MMSQSKLLYAYLAAVVASSAFAEPERSTSGREDEAGWLTVYAPKVLRQPADRRSGALNDELVAISHRVSYAGLDLAMHADVLELRKRIVESAQIGCEQLAALSPLADLDTQACAREAIEDAMERAQKVVAAAMEGYKSN